MSFQPRWTPEAKGTFQQLEAAAKRGSESRRGLFKQVAKTVKLLLNDPRHPSLQTHEFHSLTNPFDSKAKVFEVYAQPKTPGAYRVFWCSGPKREEITIIAITPHP
jgi:hypothetical protein